MSYSEASEATKMIPMLGFYEVVGNLSSGLFCMDMQGKISDHYGNAVIAKSANYMINL